MVDVVRSPRMLPQSTSPDVRETSTVADTLPQSILPDVRETIIVAEKLMQSVDKAYGTEATDGWIAQFRRESNAITLGLRHLNFDPGSGTASCRR